MRFYTPSTFGVRFLIVVMILGLAIAAPSRAQSTPEALRPGIAIRSLMTANGTPIRIDCDQTTGSLFYTTIQGDIYRIDPPLGSQAARRVYTSNDHGIPSNVLGFAIAADGRMFVVGSQSQGSMNRGVIARGMPAGNGTHTWSTVARTEAYATSATAFDHNFNGIAVSPDGTHLFVNSGSRTDHGEVQDNGGQFPGVREIPLTSAIFRIPAGATDVELPSNEQALRDQGYLFADGVRNSFDFAFDAGGNLFATENAADRNDTEELNWVREGHHYGFPWRIGTNDTPQQFPDYDPDQDLLLPDASLAVSGGFYHNDPTYPAPPDGVVFTDPVRNLGPDADRYMDESDGSIRDGGSVGTFTPHRSPLGLVFDTSENLPADFAGNAFVLSWTSPSDQLLSPFGDEGEDLLMLDLQRNGDNYDASVQRIIKGFSNPIDAVLVGQTMYVLEFGGSRRILEVSFIQSTSVEDGENHREGLGLHLYPNPSTGLVTMSLGSKTPGPFRIEVYDLLGHLIAVPSSGMTGGADPGQFEWDASPFAAGVYIVRATVDNVSVMRRIVLVQ